MSNLRKSELETSNLKQLVRDLPRVRALAQTASLEEAAAWGEKETAHFNCELKWCVEALQELAMRVKAAASRS